MAKLRSSFPGQSAAKPPVLGASSSLTGSVSKASSSRDLALKILSSTSSGVITQALNFGTLHTKVISAASQSGSSWMNLLGSASGGASSLLGGGLLSSGGIGLVGKLLNLFGGGKSTPVAPTPFQSPVQQQESINLGTATAVSSTSLRAHPLSTTGGIYQQANAAPVNQHVQSAQVVQIVKQALLTSSSLNDVISEI